LTPAVERASGRLARRSAPFPAADAGREAKPAGRVSDIAVWSARVALYLGLFFGVGGAFFVRWIGPGSIRSFPAGWSIMVGLTAGAISVALQSLDAGGLNFGDGATWRPGVQRGDRWGPPIAALTLALGVVSVCARGAVAKALSLLALLGVGPALAAGGHAANGHPQWIIFPALVVHGISGAFWAGALIPLVGTLASRTPDSIAVLRRFSMIAPLAVLPMAAAGMTLALLRLGDLDAFWTTPYGRVLAAKLVPLGMLFLLATANRFWLTEQVEAGRPGASAWLRLSVRIEIALVLAIFAAAALWHVMPMPADVV